MASTSHVSSARASMRGMRRSARHGSGSSRATTRVAATAVPRVPLGASGVDVPAIGLGAWAWGNNSYANLRALDSKGNLGFMN